MSYGILMGLLLLAALLEAGGDAIVRLGLLEPSGARRALLIGAGGLVLLAYGCVVNSPGWDFGRLIGVYIVFFFVVAQVVSWLVFGHLPSTAVWIGGALVVLGGVVMSMPVR